VHVHRRAVHPEGVERRAIEARPVGRGVKEEDGAIERSRAREAIEILPDRLPPALPDVDGNRVPALLRGDAAGIDVA